MSSLLDRRAVMEVPGFPAATGAYALQTIAVADRTLRTATLRQGTSKPTPARARKVCMPRSHTSGSSVPRNTRRSKPLDTAVTAER